VLYPEWETFYVIVGSAAGALTGLMFVAIALSADTGGSPRVIAAFGTPTVVHFGAALLLSTSLAAPWPSSSGLRIWLVIYGVAGVGYTLLVMSRANRQDEYEPVFEDWLFHAALPFASYAGVLVAAAALAGPTTSMLFLIGAAALLMLFVGMHNAWDTVTWLITARRARTGAAPPVASPEDVT
jgi:hypothetical protein